MAMTRIDTVQAPPIDALDSTPQTQGPTASPGPEQPTETADASVAAGKNLERDLEANYFRGELDRAQPRPGAGVLYDDKTKPGKESTETKAADEVPPPPKIGDGTSDELGQAVADAAAHMVGQNVIGPNGQDYSKHPDKAECFYMIDKILRDAGAKTASDFDKITGKTDQNYRWSAVQIDLKDAKPGDVLQFRDYTTDIHTDTKTTKTGAANSVTHGGNDLPLKRPQHSAIVLANNGDGTLTIAEQHVLDRGDPNNPNPPLSSTVRKNTLYTKDVPAHPKTTHTEEQGNVTAKVQTTESITVTGKVWVYRPQKK